MQIPKHIDKALKERTFLARQLDRQCGIIDAWLREHDVEPDSSCWLTGVEIYVNPDLAEEEVRRAIAEAEDK